MRRRGVLCAAAGAVLIGCVGGDVGAVGHVRAWADGTPVVWSDEEMPELPLDAYEFGGRDKKDFDDLDAARNLLAQHCMVRRGFADFPREPKYPGIGGKSATTASLVAVSTGPVGPYDLGNARRWGYGWDPEKKMSLPEPKGREMTTEEVGVYYGDGSAPHTGCSGEASDRIERGVSDSRRMWSYVGGREMAVRDQVDRDPQMRRAYRAWADCVVDKGFKRYANPVRAFDDKAWKRGQNGNTTRTDRELGTAVADIACKRAHNTAGVWWTVARRLQQRELARHQGEFEAVRKDRDTLRANIRDVLGAA
ncbi:hypothetical protein AB0J38_12550 [Streptomyces sp. NPDC050095]|uniref:hypothetical protein n=1 Tax=unclassified Streptomyces TaxID=2593676 RepID=UPI00343F0AAD